MCSDWDCTFIPLLRDHALRHCIRTETASSYLCFRLRLYLNCFVSDWDCTCFSVCLCDCTLIALCQTETAPSHLCLLLRLYLVCFLSDWDCFFSSLCQAETARFVTDRDCPFFPCVSFFRLWKLHITNKDLCSVKRVVHAEHRGIVSLFTCIGGMSSCCILLPGPSADTFADTEA